MTLKAFTTVFLSLTIISSAFPAKAAANLSCKALFARATTFQAGARLPRIAVISGTNRDGSNTVKVAQHVLERMRLQGADAVLVDIAEVPATTYSGSNYFNTPKSFQKKFDAVIADADAVIVVFPEYHGTYPGILGTFLNYLQAPLDGKPVGMVGISAGILGGQKGAEHLSSTFRHRKSDIVGEAQVNVAQVDGAMENGRIKDTKIIDRIDNAGRAIIARVERKLEEDLRINEFLEVARLSNRPLTYTLSSGIEVRGQLVDVLRDKSGTPIHMRWQGATELRENGGVINGQGSETHGAGFSMPVGKVKAGETTKSLSDIKSMEELAALGLKVGEPGVLTYESGVVVTGILKSATFSADGQLQVLTFQTAKTTLGSKTLFDPAWGQYDIAVADKVKAITP